MILGNRHFHSIFFWGISNKIGHTVRLPALGNCVEIRWNSSNEIFAINSFSPPGNWLWWESDQATRSQMPSLDYFFLWVRKTLITFFFRAIQSMASFPLMLGGREKACYLYINNLWCISVDCNVFLSYIVCGRRRVYTGGIIKTLERQHMKMFTFYHPHSQSLFFFSPLDFSIWTITHEFSTKESFTHN